MIRKLKQLADDRQLLKYLIVGGVNTLFGYTCFLVLITAGLADWLAMALGTVLGVIFNFFSTGGVVFENRDPRRLLRFVPLYALLYAINLASLKVLLALGLNVYLASSLLVLPMAFLGFVLNKNWVFRRSN